jgi:hypothetical protein
MICSRLSLIPPVNAVFRQVQILNDHHIYMGPIINDNQLSHLLKRWSVHVIFIWFHSIFEGLQNGVKVLRKNTVKYGSTSSTVSWYAYIVSIIHLNEVSKTLILTLYGRLPDTNKQNIFRLYILYSLGVKTTEVHFQI